MMEEKRKWKISDIGRLLANSLMAILKGEFIMRLKIDKYFPQIAWTFLLFALMILFSLKVDMTLGKVEENKKLLHEYEVTYTQKKYELITLGRRSTVSKALQDAASDVAEPTKPAITLNED